MEVSGRYYAYEQVEARVECTFSLESQSMVAHGLMLLMQQLPLLLLGGLAVLSDWNGLVVWTGLSLGWFVQEGLVLQP